MLKGNIRAVAIMFLAVTLPSTRAAEGKAMTTRIDIVPRPVRVQTAEGAFLLGSDARIRVAGGSDTVRVGEELAARLRAATGFPLPVIGTESPEASAGDILLSTERGDATLGAEGYTLAVTPHSVVLRAPRAAGLFYGTQTLRQMLPPAVESADPSKTLAWRIPAVDIWDRPRFAVRGYMLDSCRHMQSVEFIKRTIDRLAHYKLNTFHWHLTEDQGWRLEIRKYPKLSEVGAWRDSENGRYGGFYTQDEVREIVRYAADRFVTVVPEIDMPGHTTAALAAYPELGCTGGPYEVRAGWGIAEDVLCPGREETFRFVEDVLAEVMDLFPSRVIHIGGDECPRVRWKDCPRCQETIRREGLKDEAALQNYFTRRVMDYLRRNGRRLQGWNEIMEGGDLPDDAIIHQWNWENAARDAAKAGNDVVVSQHQWMYFDYPYTTTPMRKVYDFEPVPSGLDALERRHILGPQANLWTEYRPTEESVDEFTWPRVLALAEVAWSQREGRDWDDFRRRLMDGQYERLAGMGLGTPGVSAETIREGLDARTDLGPAKDSSA